MPGRRDDDENEVPEVEDDATTEDEPCPETGKPHRFTWDEEYDFGLSGSKTYNCEDCGALAPAGWQPGEE